MWLVMRVVCSTRVAFDGTRSRHGQAGSPRQCGTDLIPAVVRCEVRAVSTIWWDYMRD